MDDQKIKADAGKPKLTLVPHKIIFAIAKVREYGLAKYGESESWRKVDVQRYRDALFRHLLAYLSDPSGIDDESGLPHLWHLACNVAFLCELESSQIEKSREDPIEYSIPIDTDTPFGKFCINEIKKFNKERNS